MQIRRPFVTKWDQVRRGAIGYRIGYTGGMMTETALTRSAKVYDLIQSFGPRGVVFGQSDGEGWQLTLDEEPWRDMGEPKQITVTIEPGDALNEGGPCVCGHVSLEQHAADDALEARWKRIMAIRAIVRDSGGLQGADEALTASLRELSKWSSATSPHWWCPNCETTFLGVDPETVTSCMGCGSTKGAA